jgi:hypothetical protein
MRTITHRVARRFAITAIFAALFLVQASITTPALAAPTLAKSAFVHHYVKDGYSCGLSKVMVGIHITKQKVTCARLNYDYKVANRIVDKYRGTQVSSNPSMHGCPANYLIQALQRYGLDEDLTCISLKNNLGQALEFTSALHDGRGPNDNGTQSTIYGLTPTMHVCPRDYAMRGIHQSQNDLYCAG